MKRIHDTNRIAERFVRAGLIAAIAAALLLPTAFRADGAEAAPRHRMMPVPYQQAQSIPLPPVPQLNAVPWLTLPRAPKGPMIDTLQPAPAKVDPAYAVTGLPLWSAATTDTNG